MKKRVVVTGLGVLSPNGIGKEAFWKNTVGGKSGVRRVTDFDVSQFRSQIAAQVDFDPIAMGLTPEEVERMDRYVQFAVVGADAAITDAKLVLAREDRWRAGVCLANAICGTRYMDEEFLRVTNGGKEPIDPRKARPHLYDAAMFNTPSIEIAARHNLGGFCATVSTGCTAGSDAVGYAYEIVSHDEADIMVTGAAEAPLCPITFAAFDVINAISSARNDAPETASRPFDKNRDGFVLSEGCGILILEELGHARARGARIYCEVNGFGSSCNAYHMTDLPADGDPMVACINQALEDAGIAAEKIDYINAHGSSTQQNDVFETNAYKQVFGTRSYEIPISSIKSMIGHPLAAANSLELVASAITFETDILPPTINQDTPDPDCDLDYVANKAREGRAHHILKTSSGFAGVHSAMVLSRWSAS
jgi:beta-ketoacyl-acyl-carrier-protein synthase II